MAKLYQRNSLRLDQETPKSAVPGESESHSRRCVSSFWKKRCRFVEPQGDFHGTLASFLLFSHTRLSFSSAIFPMRQHKLPSFSHNRRPTILYLVFAVAFFSLLVFAIQSSLFAGKFTKIHSSIELESDPFL